MFQRRLRFISIKQRWEVQRWLFFISVKQRRKVQRRLLIQRRWRWAIKLSRQQQQE
jgi:hypothetical protein